MKANFFPLMPVVVVVFSSLSSFQAQAGSINSSSSSMQSSCDVRQDPLNFVRPTTCTALERARILDGCYLVRSQQVSNVCSWQSCKGTSVVGKLPVYDSSSSKVMEYGIATSISNPPASVSADGTFRPINFSSWPRAYLTVREALCLRKHFCSAKAKAPYDSHQGELCALDQDLFAMNPYLHCASVTSVDCSGLSFSLSPNGVLPNRVLTADAMVEQFYRGVMLGASDSNGKKYWVDRTTNSAAVDKGTCISTAQAFFNSMSANDRANIGSTAREIVGGWYRGFLDRDPDASGWDYWIAQLPWSYLSTDQLSNVLGSFLEQPEFRKRCDAVCRPSWLSKGTSLTSGTVLLSSSCTIKHSLSLDQQGALNIKRGDGSVQWTTGPLGATRLTFQADGNLVLYNASGAPVWASNTVNMGGQVVVFREGGRLSIEDANGADIRVLHVGEGRTR